MRQDQRQKSKEMATIRENSMSDHRPKPHGLKLRKKAWRSAGRGESVRRVNWEKLKITENNDIFRKCVNQEIHTKKDEENVTNWDWIVNIQQEWQRMYAAWKRTTQSHGSTEARMKSTRCSRR